MRRHDPSSAIEVYPLVHLAKVDDVYRICYLDRGKRRELLARKETCVLMDGSSQALRGRMAVKGPLEAPRRIVLWLDPVSHDRSIFDVNADRSWSLL